MALRLLLGLRLAKLYRNCLDGDGVLGARNGRKKTECLLETFRTGDNGVAFR